MEPLGDGLHRVTVARLMCAAEFPALVAEYTAESALVEMPPPNPTLETYQRMERSGALTVFVWAGAGRIVGYLKVLVSVIPHYERPMGVVESIFVASAHRSGGAGLRLIDAAEAHARKNGCIAVMLSSPVGGRLAGVLGRRGYRAANTIFVKQVTHG